MKKYLIGFVVGAVLFVPCTAFAAISSWDFLPWTKSIYRISDFNQSPSVSVFDDGDNKCYVASSREFSGDTAPLAISCVKATRD